MLLGFAEEGFALEVAGFGVGLGGSPRITDISPAPGSAIAKSTSVLVTVTGLGGLRALWLSVDQGNRREVVYQAGSFVGPYQGIAYPVQDGHQIQFSRAGGWLSSPRVYLGAVDQEGNRT